MQTTMEPGSLEQRSPPSSRTWLWVLAVVAALVLGVFAGQMWSSDSDGQPATVTPNGVDLTDRQVKMVDVTTQYVAAWQANDGEAAASFMTADATFSHPELNDSYSVADGSFQELVSNTAVYSTMKIDEPMLVDGDHVVLTGRIDSMNLEFLSVIDFTDAGEPLITSEIVYFVS